MRKANKQKIAAALTEYASWRAMIDPRLATIRADGAAILRQWAEEVRQRIAGGEIGFSVRAYIRSVMRAIEDFENGRYIGTTDSGGFICASA
jgi:hypothetical protein